MTASSPAPGTLLVLQLPRVSQSPPAALIQFTVAGWMRSSRIWSFGLQYTFFPPNRRRALHWARSERANQSRNQRWSVMIVPFLYQEGQGSPGAFPVIEPTTALTHGAHLHRGACENARRTRRETEKRARFETTRRGRHPRSPRHRARL